MLLEVEANQGLSDFPDSLMDRVLVGIITSPRRLFLTFAKLNLSLVTADNNHSATEPSEYILTLLRDPTSSHLLETLVSRAPPSVFDILWSTYFKGTLARLAMHPVANFVVAKAVERLNEGQLAEGCLELKGSWKKIVSKLLVEM